MPRKESERFRASIILKYVSQKELDLIIVLESRSHWGHKKRRKLRMKTGPFLTVKPIV